MYCASQHRCGRAEGNQWSTSVSNYVTPKSRVFLEKLTVTQLVKKFPAFCGSPMFIAVFTKARH